VFTRRPEHLKTFDYLGRYRYSLTFCTHRRRALFTTADTVALILEQIVRSAHENGFAIIVYAFMPDHVHLLVEGLSESSDCKQFIARAKQYSGYCYSRRYKDTLWQRYGFEHVLRHDELTLVVARYILENPVRAGLVTRVEDYPFVGSLVYELKEILEAVAELERSG
jgi:putative transposase